jgi:GDP-4-dehydro-6-deoxy-D-mannose reductase
MDSRAPSRRFARAGPTIPERVLVTGAQGFLGHHLVQRWLGSRPSASVLGVGRSARLDATFTYDLRWGGGRVPAPLPATSADLASEARYAYEPLDLGDPDGVAALLRSFRPDVIVHCASALRDDPWQALIGSNIRTVIAILEAIVASPPPAPRLVLVSSGSVYGRKEADRLPLDEADACIPLDLYAATKLAGEDVARILSLEHDVPLVRARVFNLLGPGLQDRHLAASLAGQIVSLQRGIDEGPLHVGRLDTTRDFIDVRDASNALLVLAERAPAGPGSVYNVATGREVPVRSVVEDLLRLGGVSADRVEHDVSPRPVDIPRSVADVRRAGALGIAPAFDLVDTLSEMLRYYDESVVAPGA